MDYRLFPYERDLGLRELTALGAEVDSDDGKRLIVLGDAELLNKRLTYFAESVGWGATDQWIVEDRAAVPGRPGGRQATRYGLHGIHEYKGKFNPQVVRALCNVVDADASTLVDPFCGSGTALVEGMRLGLDVLGVDQSPIAAWLASVKAEAWAARKKVVLARDLGDRAAEVGDAIAAGQDTATPVDLVGLLPEESVKYLGKWFDEAAYAGLSRGLRRILANDADLASRLAGVALSSILRKVSLQLPEDLRVRRRPASFVAPPIAPLFRTAVERIRHGLEQLEGDPDGNRHTVVRGSAEDPAAYAEVVSASRRLILTSPPYATALPYIDTDRLSGIALGLMAVPELASLERGLLGSREWKRSVENDWNGRRSTNADRLPDAVTELADRIDSANTNGGAGFRRRAVPSLLYRYFSRMGAAFDTWREVLAPGESAVLIVGHNRTTAGGEAIAIPTPTLLADVASARGLTVCEVIPLETWPRFGLHGTNGVQGEDAVVLRAPD